MRAFYSRWRGWWDTLHQEHSDHIDALTAGRIKAAIFVASALTLYVEMVMVRWHASCSFVRRGQSARSHR